MSFLWFFIFPFDFAGFWLLFARIIVFVYILVQFAGDLAGVCPIIIM